jgi:hypothetical protein
VLSYTEKLAKITRKNNKLREEMQQMEQVGQHIQ